MNHWVPSFRSLIGLTLLWIAGGAMAQQPAEQVEPIEQLRHNPPRIVALEHARVIARPGVVLEDATVVLDGDRIVSVGPVDHLPPGTERIDLSGKSLYPGLIDAYVELPLEGPAGNRGSPYWNANVSPQRNAGELLETIPAAEARRKTGFTVALVAPQHGIIKGTSCLVLLGDGSVREQLLREQVAQHLRLTVAPGFRMSGYPTSPMGAVALARQAFYDSQWYRAAWDAYRGQPDGERPELDAALSALADRPRGQLFIADAPTELYALRADAFAREFSLDVALRGSGREYRRAAEVAGLGRTLLLPVDFPKAPNVATREAAREAELDQLMHWELAPENPARMLAAGATICLTTAELADPGEFLAHVREAVNRGLSTDAALAATTTAPAQLLGIDRTCGAIAPGLLANLLVTDGELFTKETKLLETWVAGKRFQHSPEKPKIPSASFDLELQPSPVDGMTLKLELAQKDDKSEASLISPTTDAEGKPRRSPLEKLTRVEDQLTAVFRARKLDDRAPEGLALLSLTLFSPAAAEQRLFGTIAWPDGSVSQIRGVPCPPAPEASADHPPTATAAAAPAASEPVASEPVASEPVASEPVASEPVASEPAVAAPTAATAESPSDAPAPDLTTAPEPNASERAASVTSTEPAEEPKPNDAEQAGAASAKPADESPDAAPSADAEKASPGSAAEESKDEDAESEKWKQVFSSVQYPFGAFGRASAIPDAPADLVLRNATVWTCGEAGLLQQADVHVHSGLIAAVGQDLEVPPGTVEIDASNFHVTPGIVDCHSHMATDGGINEVGQVVTAEVRIGDFIDSNDISIYRQLAGGVTTANILHGSANPIGGQNQVIKLRWGAGPEQLKFANAPAGIKFALGENVKQSNFGGGGGRYPASRMGVEQLIEDQLRAAREYRAAHESYRRAPQGQPPRRDLQMEALAEILDGERWIHCHSYRQDEIQAFLDLLDRFSIRIGSLQHILEGYKVADRLAAHGATASSFADWWAYKIEVMDAIPHNGALLHSKGVVVSFNSDDAELARHLNHEAAKAMKYGGVSAEEALKFVTLNPAKQLRIDQWVGSIEPGKHADLVLWNGNPLSTLSRCEQTWVDGRLYFDRQADVNMRSQQQQLHAQLVQKVLNTKAPMAEEGETKPSIDQLWPRHDIFCGHGHHDEFASHHEHLDQ
jgi:N-acetylglucosamine-6-phosphate deacetylase